MKHNFYNRKNVVNVAIVLVVGWITLLFIQYIGNYFETEKLDLANIPAELQLKSEPSDVLYAETYTDSEGGGVTKYAYLDEEIEDFENEDVSKRTNNSRTEIIGASEGGGTTYKATFYAAPKFYKDGTRWREIEYATTTLEVFSASGAKKYVARRTFIEKLLPGKPLFAETQTFNPDANVETSSFDGQIGDSNSDSWPCGTAVWNTSRGSATGLGNDTNATTTVSVYYWVDPDPDFGGCDAGINRAILLFDTSSLPDNAYISSAVFSVYVSGKSNGDNDGDDYIRLVTSDPGSNTAIASGDYDSLGTTALASDIDIGAISTSTYMNMSLNSTGLAEISTTSVTKLGLREGHDVINSVPCSDLCINSINFNSADHASNDPKLEVVYRAFSFGQWFPF